MDDDDDDRPHNVAQCLLALGITPDIRDGLFADCDSMDDEFKVVKTLYRAKILEEHPDKVSTVQYKYLLLLSSIAILLQVRHGQPLNFSFLYLSLSFRVVM